MEALLLVGNALNACRYFVGHFGIYWKCTVLPWIELNCALAAVGALMLWRYKKALSILPAVVAATAIFITTTLSYFAMWDFYFGKSH
jgi:hypothetical protein